ncbi:MAG: hypothetical protein Q8N05_08345 [Bacteroidota bacterium]|nr:hypothetical protein [Bacteroidota bacterium]
MGHIKEPAGVDLIINSRPLTKEEETAISEYIRAYKAKHSHRQTPTKRTAPKTIEQKNVEA